ncbi:hypothetical protein [Parapedobacter sp. DT-150]|uniref:hypothetical protein n=1 Tax=Parapedobacter sp. DT-150 TaxID=3396162 RepID=UPI003F1B706C
MVLDNKKNHPEIPLDVENTDETREPTGEDLRYNENQDSFELDSETADAEYQHPDPYDTAAPQGEDDNSTYDEENQYTPDEYRDKQRELNGELGELDAKVTDDRLTQLDETDAQLAETPEDPLIVPPQRTGKQVDLDSQITLPDEDRARDFFALAKRRLFDVSHWYEIAEMPMSTFVLTDEYGGEAVKSRPKEGDHIRIDIPGPGPSVGDGYDWVQVEDITEAETLEGEQCAMTLRPTANPLKLNDDTAHFFQDVASSTLIVERRGNEVIARYHGRNEVINTDTDSALDNARNAMVGAGAKLGLSYPQWKSLVAGLVKEP